MTRRLSRTPAALALTLAAALTLPAATAGCGDDPTSTVDDADAAYGAFDTVTPGGGEPDVEDADGAPDMSEDAVADAAGDAVADAAGDAVADAAGDSDAAGDAVADVADADAFDGNAPVDTDFPDLVPDTTPPTVASVTPDSEEDAVALPFTVSVTFSEPIAPNTIAPQTFKVLNADGQEVPGDRTISEAGDTIIFTPTAPDDLEPASPFDIVVIGGIVADLAGNKLQESFTSRFYTETYPDMDGYHALAEQFAPSIRIATTEGLPHVHVPIAFDADGNWDGSDNRDWLLKDATELLPTVHYAVAETVTHYFIYYLYFFPWVNHPIESFEHGNGAPGAMVTVEKGSDGEPDRPVAVTTYFREKTAEENVTFVTTDSGLVPTGKSPDSVGIKAAYERDALFPEGRFEAYVSAGQHESCLWIHEGETLNCQLNVGIKASMTSLLFAYDTGVPTPITKPGGWPNETSDVTEPGPDGEEVPVAAIDYQLLPMLAAWWPRRLDVVAEGGAMFGGDFDYDPTTTNVGAGQVLPSKFIDPVEELDLAYGRPVWAWGFNPGVGQPKGIQQGWLGMDPAFYFVKRHQDPLGDNTAQPYDAGSGTGFSFVYCFQGFAGIDQRDTEPLCGAGLSE